MKDKIEEILDMLFIEETKYKVNVAQSSTVSNTVPDIRSSPEYSAVNIVGKEAVVKLLSTLIQKERKDAVEGFAVEVRSSLTGLCVKLASNGDGDIATKIAWVADSLIPTIAKEYLSSIGKDGE